MYLHIGGNYFIKSRHIVGIFDIDKTTVSQRTREFLSASEKKNEIIYTTSDLPRSFIIYKENGISKVYVTQLSSATLQKRKTGD